MKTTNAILLIFIFAFSFACKQSGSKNTSNAANQADTAVSKETDAVLKEDTVALYAHFSHETDKGGGYTIIPVHKDVSYCELDFDANGKSVYFDPTGALPNEMVNTETFETKPVRLPYSDAEIMILYLPTPSKYKNPFALYFVKTPQEWKLAAVDDSLCNA